MSPQLKFYYRNRDLILRKMKSKYDPVKNKSYKHKNASRIREYGRNYFKKWYSNPENKKRSNARSADWQKRHPDYHRDHHLKYLYGLTPGTYKLMLKSQGGACAICKRIRRLSVDHCHKTGRIRALLCQSCNAAIGLLREDVFVIENALNYIKYHQ